MSISLIAENHRLEKILVDKDKTIATLERRIEDLEEYVQSSEDLRTKNGLSRVTSVLLYGCGRFVTIPPEHPNELI